MSVLFKHRRTTDIIILLVWTLFVTFFSLYILKPQAAWSITFLYFVLPTGYLIWKYRPHRSKILAGALLIGLTIPLSFDLLIHLNESWFVPADKLLIPYKFLGFYPVDELLWFFLLAIYTIVFYEVFIDNEKILRLSKNLKIAFIIWTSANVIALAFILVAKSALLMPFSYLCIVAPFSLPPILYVMYKDTLLIKKFIVPTAFFFFVAINFEFVGLTFGHWVFADDYVGWISILDRYFPFEEFLYWMLLYPATVLSYYELLVDDER